MAEVVAQGIKRREPDGNDHGPRRQSGREWLEFTVREDGVVRFPDDGNFRKQAAKRYNRQFLFGHHGLNREYAAAAARVHKPATPLDSRNLTCQRPYHSLDCPCHRGGEIILCSWGKHAGDRHLRLTTSGEEIGVAFSPDRYNPFIFRQPCFGLERASIPSPTKEPQLSPNDGAVGGIGTTASAEHGLRSQVQDAIAPAVATAFAAPLASAQAAPKATGVSMGNAVIVVTAIVAAAVVLSVVLFLMWG